MENNAENSLSDNPRKIKWPILRKHLNDTVSKMINQIIIRIKCVNSCTSINKDLSMMTGSSGLIFSLNKFCRLLEKPDQYPNQNDLLNSTEKVIDLAIGRNIHSLEDKLMANS